MTVSDYPCANSMFEALSLSFRDQMSIFLFFFAEMRQIIRRLLEVFHEMLTDVTIKASSFALKVPWTLRKILLLVCSKDYFSPLRFRERIRSCGFFI